MEEIQKYEAGFSLDKPARALDLANVLKDYIKQNGLTTKIQGRDYVNVEGWQFAGGMLGIFPVVQLVVDESNEHEVRFRSEVALMDMNGMQRGFGIAICDNQEPGKTRFAPYAICSMSQTRAIGKAYRNLLAWVIRAAGFEPTPAEEMDVVKVQHEERSLNPSEKKVITLKPAIPTETEYTGALDDYPMPFTKHKGKVMKDFTASELTGLVQWCEQKNKHHEFQTLAKQYVETISEPWQDGDDGMGFDEPGIDQKGIKALFVHAKKYGWSENNIRKQIKSMFGKGHLNEITQAELKSLKGEIEVLPFPEG
jgi:hypothetical protein